MRKFMRGLGHCEAGAGLVEYSLLIAVLALGLVGVLTLYRRSVDGLTTRTSVTISAQAGSSYGSSMSGGNPAPWRPSGQRQDPADADSSSSQPDQPDDTELPAATRAIP